MTVPTCYKQRRRSTSLRTQQKRTTNTPHDTQFWRQTNVRRGRTGVVPSVLFTTAPCSSAALTPPSSPSRAAVISCVQSKRHKELQLRRSSLQLWSSPTTHLPAPLARHRHVLPLPFARPHHNHKIHQIHTPKGSATTPKAADTPDQPQPHFDSRCHQITREGNKTQTALAHSGGVATTGIMSFSEAIACTKCPATRG